MYLFFDIWRENSLAPVHMFKDKRTAQLIMPSRPSFYHSYTGVCRHNGELPERL